MSIDMGRVFPFDRTRFCRCDAHSDGPYRRQCWRLGDAIKSPAACNKILTPLIVVYIIPGLCPVSITRLTCRGFAWRHHEICRKASKKILPPMHTDGSASGSLVHGKIRTAGI